MDWLIEANKLGKYVSTYKGFRIYISKRGYSSEELFEKDGEMWRRTEFITNQYKAMDNQKTILEGVGIEDISYKIDFEDVKKYFAKKDAKETYRINR